MLKSSSIFTKVILPLCPFLPYCHAGNLASDVSLSFFQHRKSNRERTIKRGKKKRGQENSRKLYFFVSWTSFKHAFIIGDRQRFIKWTCPFK